MEAVIEKECSALGGLFQTIISDMKGSYPVWEDFINKAGKLQSQLRTTVVAAAAFLDAFQKVADMATNTRGGTREIGSALTRMCMRHRSIEAKLRQFSSALIDCLINPLQEQMEEWKKVANQLDKDHAKEYKKARQEIKKKSSDTLKLQKKAKKGRGDIQPQLDSALQDVNDKYLLLEETEKQAVRKALIEERGRFCTFISMLRPVIEEEISMLGEITHLQTISEDLKSLTMDPHKLPSSSEQVILDLKGSDYSWSYQTPPSSPSTTMSRKSSVCSSLNSVNSSDSRSSGSHSHSPSSHYRYRSSNLAQQAPVRLSSVSSHDSGFISQDAFQSKSPSPMPPEAPNQLSNGFSHYSLSSESHVGPTGAGLFPHCLPASRLLPRVTSVHLPDYAHYYTIGPGMFPSSQIPSWKDWAKPGPYDQPLVNTLQRRKEKREPDPNGGGPTTASGPPAAAEEAQRPRSMTVSAATRPGEEMEACEELALALSRGLQLDTQRSSRDSLQCSSGYSTQTTTPCCSEDTIPSQVSDYDYFSVSGDQEADQQEFDKSSTIPRNSDISQSYRRMFQAKRPASTAGLPTTLGPAMVTPGVATIRRTPSTKPSVRRGTIGAGPIPIKTPVIPVKTPTVPDLPGVLPAPPDGPEERGEHSPESPSVGEGPQGVTSMPSSMWSGQASVNPPLPGPKPSIPEEHRQAIPESEAEDQEREPPSATVSPGQIPESDPADLSPRDTPQGEDMLNAIRRGVKLKKTTTNDRSAPRFS
ncbi:protein MTSS 1 isoform 2 [Homo sapiens]|uniref:Protein MTSS 1 n=1 Tax=Homo sapiens TaxID=9606 RepID=MTSS1_HUMAN|nr:protein MTSS 1 isoform 2 [Homo sapiens]XP_032616276.1 protein MTSS 1 isoform X2 [Hylobates moloch]XP_055143173.1 protein MTSS 1 isoform X2 [Symphalangus syndactylus]O43312.2 RecName: Full=Protein MTSS 1; AltName: Full=Metastasis suppressor YGL-1; AltName: Full=Metastasis suppressor protein 1; AltName: Full=Missing in metastasis protein [Homo sapiens]EAW92072.1 metastasis suppressor 1, isoform CRA_d [Homo sapiens]KAI2551256.1 MTSS I-BAR domain containing 1 [Homo sapiens]|eukprot:NP_055566.3 metastasis suppressor protein 1 isoform 2 [Homo sapiens]